MKHKNCFSIDALKSHNSSTFVITKMHVKFSFVSKSAENFVCNAFIVRTLIPTLLATYWIKLFSEAL